MREDLNVSTQSFRHRDGDYLAWRAAHLADGYIANLVEGNPTESRLHRASCHTLQLPIDRGLDLTGPYPKVCGTDLDELRSATGRPRACGHCSP